MQRLRQARRRKVLRRRHDRVQRQPLGVFLFLQTYDRCCLGEKAVTDQCPCCCDDPIFESRSPCFSDLDERGEICICMDYRHAYNWPG